MKDFRSAFGSALKSFREKVPPNLTRERQKITALPAKNISQSILLAIPWGGKLGAISFLLTFCQDKSMKSLILSGSLVRVRLILEKFIEGIHCWEESRSRQDVSRLIEMVLYS